MKSAILWSRVILVGYSSFFLMACDKLPVKFGLRVEDSQGNVIDCSSDNLGYSFHAPYYVEAGSKVALKYGGEKADWSLRTSSGTEVQLEGTHVDFSTEDLGEVFVFAKGTNVCNKVDQAELRLQIVEPLGKPSLSINNGNKYTKAKQVDLQHQVKGAKAMMLSNYPDCSNSMWINYTEISKAYLSKWNSNSSLYVKFKNEVRESECVSASIIHDDVAPQVQMSGLPPQENNLREVRVNVQALDSGSGLATQFCSLDGEAYQVCSSQFFKSIRDEAVHKIRTYAVDKAGNESLPVTYEFVSDFTPPQLSVLKKPEEFQASSQVEIEYKAVDARSEAKIYCRYVDEIQFQECPRKLQRTVRSEGSGAIVAYAEDRAGNKSSEVQVDFYVDKTPPVVSLSKKPSNPSKEKEASFEFQSSDRGVGRHQVFCALNEGAYQVCKSSAYYSNLENGIYSFKIYAVDALGNQSAITQYQWEIDDGIVNQEYLVEEGKKKLDLVVVIDNSSSMDSEQKEMGKRFGTFIQNLQGFDWRLGIITTDASNKNEFSGGRLVPFLNNNSSSTGFYVIGSETPDAERLFSNTIVRREGGNDTEEGIKSVRMFLDREDSSMLREGAHFATLVISDEDENSRGTGLDSYNKPENLVQEIHRLYDGKKSYTHHSIVFRPGDRNCERKGGKYEGFTYAELTHRTGGILGDVCAKDYSSQLLDIGDRIKEMSLSIALKCSPVDKDGDGKGDVRVISSISETLSYKLKGNKLIFEKFPEKGSRLNIIYHCPR